MSWSPTGKCAAGEPIPPQGPCLSCGAMEDEDCGLDRPEPELRAEIVRLNKLLHGRDMFIAERGLWNEFCRTIDRPAHG